MQCVFTCRRLYHSECAAVAAESCDTDEANENSGPSDIPLDISWMNPCIDFATKTLLDTDPGLCEMALQLPV